MLVGVFGSTSTLGVYLGVGSNLGTALPQQFTLMGQSIARLLSVARGCSILAFQSRYLHVLRAN